MRILPISLVFALFCGPLAYAEGDDAFVLNSQGKRFYALPPAGGVAANGGGIVLGSDRAALKSGFIPLDRAALTVPKAVTVTRAGASPASASAATSTRSVERDILTLFENELASAPSGDAVGAGKFRWPLPANVPQRYSSGFGMRKDPFHGRPAFHGGIDIAADPGTPVLAAADGRVKEAGYRRGFGNSVVLAHPDGSETLYGHMEGASGLRAGALVRAGQVIGRVGSTGRSTGPHLDFRIKQAGKLLDPMTKLAGEMPAIARRSAPLQRASAPLMLVQNGPNVQVQKGVRVITPQQRVALSGGFIRVR